MNHRLTYESLNRALANVLPELLNEPAWDWAMLEGPTVFYPDVLVPYLRHALAFPETNHDALTRAFDFLEQLATHDDPYVQRVLTLSVLAPLDAAPSVLDTARAWMRPATLALAIRTQ